MLSNKAKIAKLILKNKEISKPEIASQLNLSMPTVLQIVKNLMDEGLVIESGKQASKGGRKATTLSIANHFIFAVGIDITAHHVSYVAIDLNRHILGRQRMKKSFVHSQAYYQDIQQDLENFLQDLSLSREKILGIGMSFPGIIDHSQQMLIRSHVLKQNHISLRFLEDLFSYPMVFENDANSALFAEMSHLEKNTIYLSLSNSVGGSIYIDQSIYVGDGFKSAEFGHVIIVPDGRACYCGKKGCADAYCSAQVLLKYADSLEQFFERLDQGDLKIKAVWDQYLDHLSILISNLRMTFDCDIMIGGYVGGYMKKYMSLLHQKVIRYNMFEENTMYLKKCHYEKEASAIGVALYFVENYFNTL